MKEVKRTEDQLIFSNGEATIVFNRMEDRIIVEASRVEPEGKLFSINNFISYISWEHHIDISGIEHGTGPSPHIKRNGWDRFLGKN